MADFAKRPEVTVSTMGRVRNPTGEGVPALSSTARIKAVKVAATLAERNGETTPEEPSTKPHGPPKDEHETVVKTEGSSRRNIVRKKTESSASHQYDSRNKKQGGAGKGKWSESVEERIGAELDGGTTDVTDKNDPLYDEATGGGSFILTSTEDGLDKNGYDPITKTAVLGPMLTACEFKIRLSDSLREYFNSQDHEELIRSIMEMKCKEYHPQVVKRAISIACDEGPRERELISKLFCQLHPSPLSDDDMQHGFEILLDNLDDLSIDIPDVKCMVGTFLARAVVDEVLPPAFLSANATPEEEDETKDNSLLHHVIENAMRLLSREHCTARLEKVWGPGDGRPVPELKIAMDQLLKEYLMSRELDEAALCVKELNAPHFHHELVKRGVVIAMEEDGVKISANTDSDVVDASIDAIAALFAFLVKNAIVSESQVRKGVSRLWTVLDDLKLDVPGAPGMLKEFEGMVSEMGCVTN